MLPKEGTTGLVQVIFSFEKVRMSSHHRGKCQILILILKCSIGVVLPSSYCLVDAPKG